MLRMRLPKEKLWQTCTTTVCSVAVVLSLGLTACSTGAQATSTTPTTSSSAQGNNHYGIAMRDGYQISLFASGTSAYSNPDSAVVDGGHVFLDYQNDTAKDGSDNKTSTIVEYDMNGKVLKTYKASGHSDGMRIDPATKLLWVTSNEDGNPKMETIDPASGTVTPYAFPDTPHGGGFDDVYFLNGSTFITASNPTLDKNGTNVFPALYKMTLGSGKVNLTPVLMGNATATDTSTSPTTQVTLNEVDPDSLSTDNKGDLEMINQAGNEIVTLSNPGTPQQKVTRIPTGSQLDDTVWASSAKGRLLIVDGATNQTYWLKTNKFSVGTIYTQTPDDSGVIGLIGIVDPTTGNVTPVALGFGKPTGMLFVPDSQN